MFVAPSKYSSPIFAKLASMYYALALGWASAAYILSRVVASYIRERHYAQEARRLGCKPPVKQHNKLPFGVDYVYEALRADRNRVFPDFCLERYRRGGNRTLEYKILGARGLYTADPKIVQAVLATQFKEFGFGDYRIGVLAPLLGNGIFSADGAQWEHARAMMRPQFARDQVQDLELEEEHVGNLMQALPVNSTTGWTAETDLQVLFFRLTLDSACQFLFGESVDSQLLNLPKNAGVTSLKKPREVDEGTFADAFDMSQYFLATRARFQDLYWVKDGFKFRDDVRKTHRFIDYFVNVALRRRNERLVGGKAAEVEGGGRYIFLDALVNETQDPVELRHQLVNILLAGRDTTASMLGWAFYILARRPDLWRRLREAIIDDFGTYNNSKEISFTTLKNCTFLHWIMNETLRLYPVVPANTRRCFKATTLPSGGGPDGKSPVYVRPGTNVDYSVHVMHRMKEYWGEDAEEFKPDRWATRKPGWEYLPFNGGPRICLGRTCCL